MASIAASLMWRGVAKWGSPAPKSTSLAPWARSLAASAVTAMVAETSMRPMRSAKSLVAVVAVMVSLFFQIFVARWGEMPDLRRRFLIRYFEGDFGSSTVLSPAPWRVLLQAINDEFRDEPIDRSAQLEDLFHQAGAHEGVFAIRHQ